MNEIERTLTLEKVVIDENETNAINAMKIYEYLEVKEKYTDWIKRGLELFEDGIDYMRFVGVGQNFRKVKVDLNLAGKKTEYIVTLDTAKHLAMIQRNAKGKEVRDYFIAIEKEARSQSPQTYIEALEALVISEKLKQQAIETKAEIGHRREATAMNTASQAVKKVKKLKIQLDKSKDYCTIKRMEMMCHGMSFSWRLLKSTCTELELEPIDVFDANYGTVKAYPMEAWKEAYGLELTED